jgi:hypothetical protein
MTALRALFIKRWFYNLCFYFIIADADIDIRTFFGEFVFYIAQANCFLQRWRLGTRCYLANNVAIGINNFIIVAGDTAVYHFKTDKLALNTGLFLLLQGFRVGKLLGEFGNPAQAGF